MDSLAIEFGFDTQKRRLCCAGHVINIVSRAMLFGKDSDADERDIDKENQIEIDDLNA